MDDKDRPSTASAQATSSAVPRNEPESAVEPLNRIGPNRNGRRGLESDALCELLREMRHQQAFGTEVGQSKILERMRERSWGVRDAKADLSSVMDSVHAGRIEPIGRREPVAVVPLTLLARLMERAEGRHFWADLFAPNEEYQAVTTPLELTARHPARPLKLGSAPGAEART